MFISKVEPNLSVAATEGTVFTVHAPAGIERRIAFKNLSLSNTLTWRFEFSNDASVWTDVSTDATLAPGLGTSVTLVGATFYRMRASGNLTIAVKVDAEVNIVGNEFTFLSS